MSKTSLSPKARPPYWRNNVGRFHFTLDPSLSQLRGWALFMVGLALVIVGPFTIGWISVGGVALWLVMGLIDARRS